MIAKAFVKIKKLVQSTLVRSDIAVRYIGQNIETIFDLMYLADELDIDAYITQVGFEWSFLLETLNKFGFGKKCSLPFLNFPDIWISRGCPIWF